MNNDLISKLKLLSKKLGLKQYQIAQVLGCPQGTLSRWFLGTSKPTPSWQSLISSNKEIRKLLKAAGLTKEEV